MTAPARRRHRLRGRFNVMHRRVSRFSPTVRGLLWSMLAGLVFCALNALLRELALTLPPMQTQLLRHVAGVVVLLPLVVRAGWAAYRPQNIPGQFLRGIVHSLGLIFWFTAIPFITLADATAIGFTTPIFIMLGAWLVFSESMRWERWVAAAIGFAGVLIVVAPKLTGSGGAYSLVMLASSPLFAASYLITKGLTRYERPTVIVLWQGISVSVCSLPLALPHWQAPSASQWILFLMCGLMGTTAHYCLTRSFSVADISATQSVKFLDLVWASILGWLIFADHPSASTLLGGAVICASTLWIARREARTTRPVRGVADGLGGGPPGAAQ